MPGRTIVRREELIHAVRAAGEIVPGRHLVAIGSQAILGTWDENELPAQATASEELDVFVLGDDVEAALARRLDAVGELSAFHQTHGFYIDGVHQRTATLPRGWEKRVVPVEATKLNDSTVTIYCLEPHDLCVTKLLAYRNKDRDFVGALADEGLVSLGVVAERLQQISPRSFDQSELARAWVQDRLHRAGPSDTRGSHVE